MWRSLGVKELLGRGLSAAERGRAPRILYVAGREDMIPLPGPRVAVVGIMYPTPRGLDAAARVSRWLAENGAVVVSGLARGIDTMAHTAAMETGGRTVAVLGAPRGRFYPSENRGLQLRMMREQLVVSQFPPDHIARPRDFLARDRTIALLSDAALIVEAGEGSGTAVVGWEALRLGRPLFIWRDLFDSGLSWVRELTRHGALRLDEDELKDLLGGR